VSKFFCGRNDRPAFRPGCKAEGIFDSKLAGNHRIIIAMIWVVMILMLIGIEEKKL